MKKLVLLLFTLCCTALFAQEQESMKVVSFKQDLQDLSARTNRVEDNNGTPCALVKIQVLTEDQITFTGGYLVGDVQKRVNEYWAYLANGAKKIEVSHPRFEKLVVSFKEASGGSIVMVDSLSTYKLVISVPVTEVDTVLVEETFASKLEEARKMYQEAGQYSDSEYFRKAVGLYDAAMKHSECPSDMLQTLQKEYDDVRFMRKYTYIYEKTNRIAAEHERNLGYAHDSVYHYLTLAYKSALKLKKQFPAMASFGQLTSAAQAQLSKHPLGQVTKEQVVNVERPSAYGKVTIDKSVLPLNAICIYACKKAKPSAKDEKKMIGKVNSDGTYQVILPDGFDYILFEGEKKAYLVVQSNTQLNVVL